MSNEPAGPALILALGFLVIGWMPSVASAQASFTTIEEGVAFEVTAQPVRSADGWGLSISVVARSDDGFTHGLENDPLRLGGRYGHDRGGGGVQGFCEGRGGSRRSGWTHAVSLGADAVFQRAYPGNSKDRTILPGMWLELRVGLFALERLAGAPGVARPDLVTVRLTVDDLGRPKVRMLPPPHK